MVIEVAPAVVGQHRGPVAREGVLGRAGSGAGAVFRSYEDVGGA